MHHEVDSRLLVLIRAATMSPARADGMRRRLAVAVLLMDALGMNNAHTVRRMTSKMIKTKIKTPIQQLDQVSRVGMLAVDHRRLPGLRAYPRSA